MANLPERQSFLGELLVKKSNVIKVGEKTKINTNALIKEVERQVAQISSQNGGDPITGKGITKSGSED